MFHVCTQKCEDVFGWRRDKTTVHYRNILRIIFVGIAGYVAAQTGKPAPHPFLLRMFEHEMTLQPVAGPNNVENCIVVFPDGHFHLELRRQEFFDGKATLAVYESSLNPQGLERLQMILDSEDIKRLPAFVQPVPPFDPQGWHGLSGKIMRASGVQVIGYFDWQGKGPGNSDSDKREWQESQVALKPLVEWFHSVKSFKTPNWRQVSRKKGNLCGEPL
jgi:hypothetical protein